MILGYNFTRIEAMRNKEISGNLNISSSVKITSVEEKEIEFLNKQKVLEIGFEFLVEYKEGFGKIEMHGSLLYDGKDIKDASKMWKKDKKLPESIDLEVKNFLFKKCLTLAILLADEIRFPSPLPFPMIVPARKEESKSYIG
ncbi:MAG: hypothetical protein LM587_02860 [Candidatus Aenigmarchaeota archaeon]|jgi:hypothetical protein|nr:hypothetical protein [Candidatus Aenigmarchaeota archaeon]